MNARTKTFEPMREFVTLSDAMDRFLTDGFAPSAGNGRRIGELRPAVDAWENDDEMVLEMALPGLRAEDVEVTFEKESLTVAGRFPERDADQSWVLRERRRGDFKRSFALKTPIEVDKVEARFEKGILTLRLPKSEALKPRKIEVLSG